MSTKLVGEIIYGSFLLTLGLSFHKLWKCSAISCEREKNFAFGSFLTLQGLPSGNGKTK